VAHGEVSFSLRQETAETFQYLGVCNESKSANASGTPKILKKTGPHELTDDHKCLRCEISEELLNVLRKDEFARFSHVEPWFSYRYQSTHCCAKSCVETPLRTKATIATKRAMATPFSLARNFFSSVFIAANGKFN
jgi:hypothetical protein